MSKVCNYNGNDDFYPGGSIYSNPKEPSLFLSLGIGHHADAFFPLSKRSRATAPFMLSGNRVEQKKQVSIDVLPDECLFEIFRRLSGAQEKSIAGCVSKRWLMLLSDIRGDESVGCDKTGENVTCDESKLMPEAENQEIESNGYLSRCLEGKKATDVRLAAIAVGTGARGGLGKLIIQGSNSSRGVTNLGLRAVARGCPSLKVLSMWNIFSVGDEGLTEIANECHLLEKLDLSHCPSITDKSLIAVAKKCPKLTTLTIDSCSNISNEGLKAVGQYCLNLKSISIKDCPLIGDEGIVGLFSSAPHAITKVKLQSLMVTDVSLAVIGHYGKTVTELVLIGLHKVSERGFWVMGNGHGLQILKSFTVTSCQGFTDIGLEAVGKGCSNLKHCFLKKCTLLSDNGLISFVKAASALESLQLEECHRITQLGLFGSLVNSSDKLRVFSLANCFGIKDLNLGFQSMSPCKSLQALSIRNCPGFGNNSLAMLGKLCPQVQNLDFSGSYEITDDGLFPFFENCDSGLVKLNLSGCVNLTDKVVSTLTESHGWTLEVLNINGCRKITDSSLAAIAENCFLLNDLDVSKCAITDYGIAALACAKQLNMQIFTLSGCSSISEKSLPYFGKLGNTLLGLNLQHCTGICSSKVGLLVDHLRRCDILS